MKKLRVLLLLIAAAVLLCSCNAPIREASERGGDITEDVKVVLDEPILNTDEETTAQESTAPEETTAEVTTAAETTGLPETTEVVEDDMVPPMIIEPAFTTTAPLETTAPPHTTVPETEPYVPEPQPMENDPVVLMYHCINDEPNTPNTALFVRPSEFEAHARAIVDNGIDTLFADEFGQVENTSVILTFDDGYEDNYTYMFPILKKYNLKATVYMIAYKIDSPGYLTTEQIKEMSASGLVQFGSHTLDHPELSSLSEEDIRNQLAGSRWVISQVTGKAVTSVAYPSGKYDSRVMSIARELYEFAYTTDSDPYWGQDPMALPRYAILRGATAATFLYFVK